MTSLDLLHPLIALDDQGPIVHFFTPHGLVQISAKGILSQDTNNQRRSRFGEGIRRPLDKLSKVKQENSLHLILRGRWGLSWPVQCARRHQDGHEPPNTGGTYPATSHQTEHESHLN